MRKIAVLDQNTIDKIAAGEVVERPSSVVKELVENAIDAGATAVTVEITDGGKKLIRITDNGAGMEADQIPLAFLRHATSKIEKVEDLEDRFFITEGRQEFLHFLHRRNLLSFSFCIRQVDHAGWIFLNNLVAFCIAQNGRHDGQVFLHRLFLDRLAAIIPTVPIACAGSIGTMQ